MAILDLQQKARQNGRIRIGAKVETGNGKMRPAKLDSFRFTTNSELIADKVAAIYGGTVKPWSGGTEKFEVFTDVDTLDVMIPPGDAVSQWYELWSAGGCQRRCDGYVDTISGGDCMCPADGIERTVLAADGKACKPTTRVNVILPDLPDIGVWRYDSGGYYAAVELGAAAELLSKARAAGVIIPARLRLEQREVKRNNQTRKFAVVCLEVMATLRELAMNESGGTIREALPPAPARAIAAADAEPVQRRGSGTAPELEAAEQWPADPHALAEEAKAAATAEQVTRLGRFAREQGWMSEDIESATDVFEPLESFLFNRLTEVSTSAEAS